MARTSARGLSLRLACMQGLCVIRRVIDHLTEKVERRLTDLSHLNDRIWTPPHCKQTVDVRHGTTAYVYPASVVGIR